MRQLIIISAVFFVLPVISYGSNCDTLVYYSTYACRGRCPVYHILISENGKISFMGEHFVKSEKKEDTLSGAELKQVKKLLVQVRRRTGKSNYPSQKHDLPQREITFCSRDKCRKIIFYSDGPAELNSLTDYINKLATTRLGVQPDPEENQKLKQE